MLILLPFCENRSKKSKNKNMTIYPELMWILNMKQSFTINNSQFSDSLQCFYNRELVSLVGMNPLTDNKNDPMANSLSVVPTSYCFMRRFLNAAKSDKKERYLTLLVHKSCTLSMVVWMYLASGTQVLCAIF
jgi:hypothetical protein